jgi:predicted DNA-binding protein YlxM (UPF0122 family)
MSQNVTDISDDTPKPALEPKQQEALELLFKGDMTVPEVADRLGIDRRTFYRWQKLPAWVAQWNEWTEETLASLRQSSVAGKVRRTEIRVARHEAHLKVVSARKKRNAGKGDEELESGYYKRVLIRNISKDGSVTEIEKPEYDRDLVTTLIADENNLEKSLDPLPTKHEISGPKGGPIQHAVEVNLTGYVVGPMQRGVAMLLELHAANRLPRTIEEAHTLLQEMDDRGNAMAKGKPLPPMSEPYIPALFDEAPEQFEQEA